MMILPLTLYVRVIQPGRLLLCWRAPFVSFSILSSRSTVVAVNSFPRLSPCSRLVELLRDLR